MLFHGISEKMYMWLSKQPNVKEESLTDWLLFELSEKCERIKYFAFTRNEESVIGADWDWWILTDTNAFRFRVQAKKLRPNVDNWALISYSNKHGSQIDLLLESAKRDSAYPLYMFYSTSLPNIKEQLGVYRNDIFREMINWCENCNCGGYLSPAEKIFDVVFGQQKKTITDKFVLNNSLKFSALDFFFTPNSENDINGHLELLNSKYVISKACNRDYGFRYEYKKPWDNMRSDKTVPHWLDSIIRDENDFGESQIPQWFEGEFRQQLPDVSGFAILDLRKVTDTEMN